MYNNVGYWNLGYKNVDIRYIETFGNYWVIQQLARKLTIRMLDTVLLWEQWIQG